MSTMSFLLVFLLCLGVTNAYVLYAKDPFLGGASNGLTSSTDAQSIAESFLTDFRKDLVSSNLNIVAKKFSEKFKFYGCRGVYEKQDALAFLGLLRKNPTASVTLKLAMFVGTRLEITVAVDGFSPLFAQLHLRKENGDYVLTGGKVLRCPKPPRFY